VLRFEQLNPVDVFYSGILENDQDFLEDARRMLNHARATIREGITEHASSRPDAVLKGNRQCWLTLDSADENHEHRVAALKWFWQKNWDTTECLMEIESFGYIGSQSDAGTLVCFGYRYDLFAISGAEMLRRTTSRHGGLDRLGRPSPFC
jgi:hypothetical protein